MPPTTYPNGDVAQYLDLTFRCRHVTGEPRVNDDESLEVGWFGVQELPDGLSDTSRFKLARAGEYAGTTWFATNASGPLSPSS
jgi:hypothetical protein